MALLGLQMSRRRVVLPLMTAFAAGAIVLVPRGYEAGRTLLAQDDPNLAAERYLEQNFSAPVASREIADALAAGDIELARSFITLAQDRGIAVDPALADKVAQAETKAAGSSRAG